ASPAPATEEPPQGGFSVSGSESVGHSRVRSCNVVPPPQQHCDAEDPFPACRQASGVICAKSRYGTNWHQAPEEHQSRDESRGFGVVGLLLESDFLVLEDNLPTKLFK
ncbi:TPA: hypothetical protein DIS55_03960, partial [Candidatus Kaiserbacteria bacterium]|nr:hypothetical protein [Candidatus Kaiserbacteria bacterium]